VSVFLQIWDRPLYTVGGRSLISDALGICGARNVFADLGELAPAVDVESVLARKPEGIIAAAPEASARQWLQSWRRFEGLGAVQRGALVAFHDERLSRLGPGAVTATAALCEAVQSVRAKLPDER
jgi:iron complex transport system substrate-binding protein/vitamin B12 transport system substrate-binding protein